MNVKLVHPIYTSEVKNKYSELQIKGVDVMGNGWDADGFLNKIY